MKVALNLHCLHPPLTGIGRYAHRRAAVQWETQQQ